MSTSDVAGRPADLPRIVDPAVDAGLFTQLFALSPTGMAVFDLGANLVFRNPAWAELLGDQSTTAEDLLATLEADRDEALALLTGLQACIESGVPFTSRVTIRPDQPGATRHCTLLLQPLQNEDHRTTGVVCHLDDMTDIWRTSQRLRVRAETDDLTGLLNRPTIMDFLGRTLEREREDGNSTAVLFIDLNEFKSVNDQHGHAAGDRLLQQVAGYLEGVTRRVDRVGRLGGDEFIVVCPTVGAADDVMRLADRVAAGLRDQDVPSIQGGTVSWSIGVALDERGEHSAAELLAEADAAMYRQKQRRLRTPLLHDSERYPEVRRRLALEGALSNATTDGSLDLCYQAIVRLDDGLVVGHKASLEWRYETSTIPGAELTQLAEANGMVDQLDRWALTRLLARAADDQARTLRWNLNLSPLSLRTDDVANQLLTTFVQHEVDPGSVVVELAERAVGPHEPALLRSARRMADGGVHLALDEVGVGFAYRHALQSLDIGVLKIGPELIVDLGRVQAADAVVAGIGELSRRLGLATVATGIETAAQAKRCARLGLFAGQGDWFDRPSLEPVRESHLTPGR